MVGVDHRQRRGLESLERPMPRTVLPPPMGQPLLPDVPNWAWHEYGMRVGFWRFLEVLRRVAAQGDASPMNGIGLQAAIREACAGGARRRLGVHGPRLRPAAHAQGRGPAAGDSPTRSRRSRAFTGKPPRGWESPGLTETDETLDLLAEAGIEYVADWVLDEQPVPLKTRPGPIVSVPYTRRDQRRRR